MCNEIPVRSTVDRPAAICVRRRFSVPAEKVFDAWLDPELASRWLFATASCPIPHVEIEAHVAGVFCFTDYRDGRVIEYTGEYLEIVPPRRLAFTLLMEKRRRVVTRVTVAITPRKSGCELALTHENVPAARAEHAEARWTGILYGLGVTVASTVGTVEHL
ncbi:MAG: SRPBCC family protein [Burkholderiales bacterium]